MTPNRHGNHPCPCCGFYTLGTSPDNTFDICPFCFWEEAGVQLDDPTYAGGANKLSLKQARPYFAQHGSCEPGMQPHVRRPLEDKLPD